MSLVDELAKVDELRAELDALRPLPKETEQRVMQKLRLEWNYHSAKIEGGELTFGETKALLLFGITAAQKPLKDHLEMKGHNEAINILLDFAQEKRPLNEFTIRELHQLILGREPFQAEAETAGGQRTSRTITPGRYKKEPNHVMTPTGEMFYFARPEETEEKMQKLVEWYREEHEKAEIHPVLLAAEFHYRFVRIHPFDDGNGRMARLLMNLILMQHGLPPAVIQSDREQKEQYYRVLQAADAGDIEPFVEYIAREVVRSLDIMVRAAKGESIEDPDDVYKEIALMKKQLENQEELKVNVERSVEVVRNTSLLSLVPLFETVATTLKVIDDFFIRKHIVLYHDDLSIHLAVVDGEAFSGNERRPLVEIDDQENTLGNVYIENSTQVWFRRWDENLRRFNILGNSVILNHTWSSFRYNGGKETIINMKVIVDFDQYHYSIMLRNDHNTWSTKKKYDDLLSKEECQAIAHRALRSSFDRIKVFLPTGDHEGKK